MVAIQKVCLPTLTASAVALSAGVRNEILFHPEVGLRITALKRCFEAETKRPVVNKVPGLILHRLEFALNRLHLDQGTVRQEVDRVLVGAERRGLPDDDALELFRPRPSPAAEAAGEKAERPPAPAQRPSPASPSQETRAQRMARLWKANT